MLPGPLLLFELRDGQVRPRFLTHADDPWLRDAIDVHDRCVGRRALELEEALAEAEPAGYLRTAHRAAAHVLRQTYTTRQRAVVPPREARAAVFGAGTGRPHERGWALGQVARRLSVQPEALMEALFADLPGERRLLAPDEPVAASELRLRVNLANVQGLLYRATEVRLTLLGNARRVVQSARLRGLICSVARRGVPGDDRGPCTVMRISGPLALFRRTTLYGRALASLVPQLAWCRSYRLRARCELKRGVGVMEVRSGDPILPAQEPKRYDSKLEERFARDFSRAAPRWDLLREPAPFAAGRAMVFPDFLLVNRDAPTQRWYLEIAGFWTTDYLDQKLARYRAAGLDNLVLCIDADRACSAQDVPTGARLVRYRRRIDPADVLSVIGGVPPAEVMQREAT